MNRDPRRAVSNGDEWRARRPSHGLDLARLLTGQRALRSQRRQAPQAHVTLIVARREPLAIGRYIEIGQRYRGAGIERERRAVGPIHRPEPDVVRGRGKPAAVGSPGERGNGLGVARETRETAQLAQLAVVRRQRPDANRRCITRGGKPRRLRIPGHGRDAAADGRNDLSLAIPVDDDELTGSGAYRKMAAVAAPCQGRNPAGCVGARLHLERIVAGTDNLNATVFQRDGGPRASTVEGNGGRIAGGERLALARAGAAEDRDLGLIEPRRQHLASVAERGPSELAVLQQSLRPQLGRRLSAHEATLPQWCHKVAITPAERQHGRATALELRLLV